MTQTLISLQFTVMTYLLIGFILYKSKMITDSAQTFLSDLVLNFLLPMNVFVSFMENISIDLLLSLGSILLAAIVLETMLYLFTKLEIGKTFTPAQKCVARYSYLVSNGGLIGTPVIEGLLGGTGVMYCNVFLIPTRVMAYVAGETIFNPSMKRNAKQVILSFITNRIIVAMALALVLSIIGLQIPTPVFTALKNVGKCLSPFSLILVGSLLAQKINFSKELVMQIAKVCVIRLIGIPLAALLFCKLVHMDLTNTVVAVLLLGMPAGSTGAIFARKYGGDTAFAGMVVFVSTILSTGTLIGLMALIEAVF